MCVEACSLWWATNVLIRRVFGYRIRWTKDLFVSDSDGLCMSGYFLFYFVDSLPVFFGFPACFLSTPVSHQPADSWLECFLCSVVCSADPPHLCVSSSLHLHLVPSSAQVVFQSRLWFSLCWFVPVFLFHPQFLHHFHIFLFLSLFVDILSSPVLDFGHQLIKVCFLFSTCVTRLQAQRRHSQ